LIFHSGSFSFFFLYPRRGQRLVGDVEVSGVRLDRIVLDVLILGVLVIGHLLSRLRPATDAVSTLKTRNTAGKGLR